MSDQKYFDLTNSESGLERLKIVPQSSAYNASYDCNLIDDDGIVYKGFLLAKTIKGEAFTVCDVNFHKSSSDKKYQPRLIFRKTKSDFADKETKESVRISFNSGQDGYREFWKMINFLFGFKDLVDFGGFSESYQVVSDKGFYEYANNKENFGSFSKALEHVKNIGLESGVFISAALTLKMLEENKVKLDGFIKEKTGEKFIQNWLDEDAHKHRGERCLIFGLEFVSHYREGGSSGKKYDILTRIGIDSEERVLIELKGADADVFAVESKETINEESKEYRLSHELSRAIPQILEYKRNLEAKPEGDPELERVGEQKKIRIAKCVIVIGRLKLEDKRWMRNFEELKKSFNSVLEIWTYTDLQNKLDATISNLKLKCNEQPKEEGNV